MRLLHFSDLHLGIDNYGAIDAATGMSTRVGDFLRVFDVIVDRAIEERVDAVIFSGDAFKTRDPSPTLQRAFAQRVIRLAQAGVPLALLVGNHDLPNVQTRATAVDIYNVLAIPGVHVCREIGRVTIETKAGPLQVVALPWVTRSRLLANDAYRALGDQDLDRAMASLVSAAMKSLLAELDPAHPAVLLAHVSLQGASLGYEQSIMLGHDVTVGLDDLNARGFDYVALGHIHKHQQVGTIPPAVYAGSPERIDFGEEREPKGCVMVRIDAGAEGRRRTSWEFVELPARPFRTIRLRAEGDDPMAYVLKEVQRYSNQLARAIVRCHIDVDVGRERSVNVVEVRRALADAGAAHVAHVVVESDTTSRARNAIDAESARDSLRMLQRWVEVKNYDAALEKRVLARGRELIERRATEAQTPAGTRTGRERG